MGLHSLLRTLAPLVALAAGGCDKLRVSIDGEEGKPLSELDLGGPPPSKIALFGPDTVRVASGDALAITIDGDPQIVERLRFTLEDGTLGILREPGRSPKAGTATVNVTMPAPRKLLLAGSGRILAPALAAGDARVAIAGSGTVETGSVASDALRVDIAGSGSYRAAGSVRSLRVAIAGSGDARMEALRADAAKVDIAGSGAGAFTSDGTVTAKIMGSGEVRVIGRATCRVTTLGSGRLVCEPGAASAEAKPGTKSEGA